MTRFQIVGIFKDKILTAGEFNGDGYFENGHGEELCAKFPEVKTEKDYRKIVKDMNNQYFEYKEQLIYPVDDCEIDKLSWFKEICENQYWNVNVYGTQIELNKYTPAGEDFGFSVDAGDIINEIKHYADDFDVDEHVKMWIESSCDGVPSIRELLEDAEWIKNDLQNLAEALKK